MHTLRADIDYGFIEARTTYVRYWREGLLFFKGEILKKDEVETRVLALILLFRRLHLISRCKIEANVCTSRSSDKRK